MSAWCGIRPLVIDPSAKNTQSIARNHVIEVMDNKLVTIGGKYFVIDSRFIAVHSVYDRGFEDVYIVYNFKLAVITVRVFS